MKFWQKTLTVLIIGLFPAFAVFMVISKKKPEVREVPKRGDVGAAMIKEKTNSLSELEMKMATAQGELLKLEKSKQELLSELGNYRDEINTLIERASGQNSKDEAMLHINSPRFNPR